MGEDVKKGYDWDLNDFDFGENDGQRTWAKQPLSAWQIIGNIIRPVIEGIKSLAWKWDNNSDGNK